MTDSERIVWALEVIAQQTRLFQYRADNAQARLDDIANDATLSALTQTWRTELFYANDMLETIKAIARPLLI